MSEFKFDPETHIYKLDDREIPSVTQIIKEVFGEREWWSDYYAERGAALHLAVHYLNKGVLDHKSVDKAIRGRLRAYKKFKKETRFIIESSEKSNYSSKYRFAGTTDLILASCAVHIVGDIKSSFDPTVLIQLAGYSILLKEYDYGFYDVKQAVAIILNENGTYKLEWIAKNRMRYWENAFLNTLSVYNLKKHHKI